MLLACTAVAGAAAMGFEMVASRYLAPWFGSGLEVWAALIATVMAGMAAGYELGGRMADRWPHTRLAATTLMLAGTWLAITPFISRHVMEATIRHIGDSGLDAMLAAGAVALPPMAILAAMPPIAIRLITTSVQSTGQIAGRVYGASTAGSIAGVLATAFGTIPHLGSNSTTLLIAAALITAALALAATSTATATSAEA